MNTLHSILRAKERAGKNYDEAIRFTELAFRNGQRAEDLPSKERRYLESKATEPSLSAIHYNGYIFIVQDEELCITLYMAPSWFLRKQHYDGKKKVRNVKKYMRYYECGKEAA